jgi:hypothetical protein
MWNFLKTLFGGGRRQQKTLWYFKPNDRVTWDEQAGVEPGFSHLFYQRELGKRVTVEAVSPMPQEVLDKYDGSGMVEFAHQYVKIRGCWFSAEWFKPLKAAV